MFLKEPASFLGLASRNPLFNQSQFKKGYFYYQKKYYALKFYLRKYNILIKPTFNVGPDLIEINKIYRVCSPNKKAIKSCKSAIKFGAETRLTKTLSIRILELLSEILAIQHFYQLLEKRGLFEKSLFQVSFYKNFKPTKLSSWNLSRDFLILLAYRNIFIFRTLFFTFETSTFNICPNPDVKVLVPFLSRRIKKEKEKSTFLILLNPLFYKPQYSTRAYLHKIFQVFFK